MTFSLVGFVVTLIMNILTAGGLPGLLLLMAVESFGIPPLPSEVILPFAGFLVATGDLPLSGAIAAALAGGLLGSYAAYAVGRWGRRQLTESAKGVLRLNPKHLESMDRWFQERGEATVCIARLLPVVRSYISYPAGTARMEPVRFGAYTLIGATPFTLALLYVGYVLRSNWDQIVPLFHYFDYAVIAGAGVFLLYLLLRWRGVITRGFLTRRPGKSQQIPPIEEETSSTKSS